MNSSANGMRRIASSIVFGLALLLSIPGLDRPSLARQRPALADDARGIAPILARFHASTSGGTTMATHNDTRKETP